MLHQALITLTSIAGTLITASPQAADRLIDGVPLPADAATPAAAPAELRQWAEIWAGSRGGMLKHILLVEDVAEDGSAQNATLFKRGARFDRPALWLYGDHDPFYDLSHSRNNFAAFQDAGGQGTFLAFTLPGGNGHYLLNVPALWQAPVAEYLDSLAGAGKHAYASPRNG